jgi:hypothetical protein
MIFGWMTPKYTLTEQESTWEYSDEPYYNKEHEETMAIIQDILDKLDEIKVLIEEMKADEDAK